jgi:hypothetical protein
MLVNSHCCIISTACAEKPRGEATCMFRFKPCNSNSYSNSTTVTPQALFGPLCHSSWLQPEPCNSNSMPVHSSNNLERPRLAFTDDGHKADAAHNAAQIELVGPGWHYIDFIRARLALH